MASNQVSITGDLWRRLHDVADARGMKMTDLVDEALASRPWTTEALAARTRRPTVDIPAGLWDRLRAEADLRTEYGESTTAHELLEKIITDALDREGAQRT